MILEVAHGVCLSLYWLVASRRHGLSVCLCQCCAKVPAAPGLTTLYYTQPRNPQPVNLRPQPTHKTALIWTWTWTSSTGPSRVKRNPSMANCTFLNGQNRRIYILLHKHSFPKLQILIHNYTYSTAFLRMRLFFISVIISAVVGVPAQ